MWVKMLLGKGFLALKSSCFMAELLGAEREILLDASSEVEGSCSLEDAVFIGPPRRSVGHQSCHPLPPTPAPRHHHQLLPCVHPHEGHPNLCSSSFLLALLASFWDVHLRYTSTQVGAGSEFKLWSKKHMRPNAATWGIKGMVVMWAKPHLAHHGENHNQKPRRCLWSSLPRRDHCTFFTKSAR